MANPIRVNKLNPHVKQIPSTRLFNRAVRKNLSYGPWQKGRLFFEDPSDVGGVGGVLVLEGVWTCDASVAESRQDSLCYIF